MFPNAPLSMVQAALLNSGGDPEKAAEGMLSLLQQQSEREVRVRTKRKPCTENGDDAGRPPPIPARPEAAPNKKSRRQHKKAAQPVRNNRPTIDSRAQTGLEMELLASMFPNVSKSSMQGVLLEAGGSVEQAANLLCR